jgi:hypothetical protein
MIDIYHFKVRRSPNEPCEIPPSKRTPEDIAVLNGEIIPDIMEMVFRSMLDAEGRYFPAGATVQGERPVEEEVLEKASEPLVQRL